MESSAFELIYTGTNLIKNGTWPIIGSYPLSESEQKANKRIVGGDVWVADECLGHATNNELESLPKMKVFNVKYFEEKTSFYPLRNSN